MNIKTSLKILPAAGVLILGLLLVPVVSMADEDDRRHGDDAGEQRARAYSKDRAEFHNRGINQRGYDKHTRSYGRPYKYGKAYGHYKHHYGRYRYHYEPRIRSHIVPAPRYLYETRERYLDLSDLRFMIGLHTNNFDIMIRE